MTRHSKIAIVPFMVCCFLFCLSRASRGDYVVQGIMGGVDQNDGNNYLTAQPGIGAASGEYKADINNGYGEFLLNLSGLNITSITITGNVQVDYAGPENSIYIPINLPNQTTTDILTGATPIFYPGTTIQDLNTYNEDIFNGINHSQLGFADASVGVNGGYFSNTVDNPVIIQNIINIAKANYGVFFIGFPTEFQQGLNSFTDVNIDVHTSGITPQSAVPEPASLTLACLGGAGIALGRRLVKRRR